MHPRISPLLGDALAVGLTPFGFRPQTLKIDKQARTILGLKSGELMFTRDGPGETKEFLYFGVSRDVRSGVRGAAGWTRTGTVRGPASIQDLPRDGRLDGARPDFAFPFFSIPTRAGRPLDTIRHTDCWLLVPPAGSVPTGGGDQELADRMTTLLQAYLQSEAAAGSGNLEHHVADLATRIARDVADHLLPYLSARRLGG